MWVDCSHTVPCCASQHCHRIGSNWFSSPFARDDVTYTFHQLAVHVDEYPYLTFDTFWKSHNTKSQVNGYFSYSTCVPCTCVTTLHRFRSVLFLHVIMTRRRVIAKPILIFEIKTKIEIYYKYFVYFKYLTMKALCAFEIRVVS